MGETSSTQQIRRYFPGSNTPRGFHSFYEYVLPHAKASRIYLIKADPGTGKSTFMKRLADDITQKESKPDTPFDVTMEHHHCSADPKSIDAVVINERVALIDATTPHAVEPKYPGAIDQILDFTVYMDYPALSRQRDKIVRLGDARRHAFFRAYRYLAAVKEVYTDIQHLYASAFRLNSFQRKALKLIDDCFSVDHHRKSDTDPANQRISTENRHLFAQAITPDGLIDHMNTILPLIKRHIVVQGAPGTGGHVFMKKAKQKADDAGLYVECFHSSIDPTTIDHVIVPQIETAFTSLSPEVDPPGSADTVLDARQFISSDRIRKSDLNEAQAAYDRLFQIAVSSLNEAKKLHHQLEALYIPHMDFTRLDQLYKRIYKEVTDLLKK